MTMPNHKKNPTVLMIGPGPNAKGEINSVIGAYKDSELWQRYSIR